VLTWLLGADAQAISLLLLPRLSCKAQAAVLLLLPLAKMQEGDLECCEGQAVLLAMLLQCCNRPRLWQGLFELVPAAVEWSWQQTAAGAARCGVAGRTAFMCTALCRHGKCTGITSAASANRQALSSSCHHKLHGMLPSALSPAADRLVLE
jgi:hypothetical protein